MSLFSFCQWLNATPWSVTLREGDIAFPVIESLHILALGLSVGTIMWVDLRLLGVTMKHAPVSDVVEGLESWAIGGFIIMFITGLLLFLSEPMKCYTTTAFRIKAVLIVLAGLNVLFFHGNVYKKIGDWDQSEKPPASAKLVGFASFFLWMSIIILGRWTAYQ